MSQRAGRIVFSRPARPELLAKAVQGVQVALDLADDGVTANYYSLLGPNISGQEAADVWHQVAILLADLAEIDSQTLSALVHSIHKGTQDALFG